ncbi:MAG TPA: hypothetical protein EYP85_00655 [Armatimonadetes bacterium]|nr:hypothetical protein [Armatimonadota bacterium]
MPDITVVVPDFQTMQQYGLQPGQRISFEELRRRILGERLHADLNAVQAEAVRVGLNQLTAEEIAREIQATRREQ